MDNLRDKMARAAQTRQVENEVARQRYNDSSKRRLISILEKKLQTSFIGALSQFEQFFGELWGYNKDDRKLTPEELEMKEKWELARTNILNNGNNQLRAMHNELSQYNVTWNRYQTNLKPVSPKEDEGGNSN